MLSDIVFDELVKKTRNANYDEESIRDSMKEAEYTIRNETGRWLKLEDEKYEDLPMGLCFVWVNLALLILENNREKDGIMSNNIAQISGVIKTIKEGDTSIEYDTGSTSNAASNMSVDEFITLNRNEINRYRRVYTNVGD